MVTLKAPAGNGNMPSTSTNSQTVSASEVFRAEPLSKRTAGHADLEAEQQCILFCCCLSVVGNRHGMVLPALQGDVLEEACSNTTNPTIHQWWAQTTPPVSISPFLLGAERTLAGYPQIKLILGNALSQVTGSQAHVHESKKNSLVYLFLMCDPAQQGPDGILNTKRAFTEQLSLSNLNLLPLNSQSHKFLLKGANFNQVFPTKKWMTQKDLSCNEPEQLWAYSTIFALKMSLLQILSDWSGTKSYGVQ